MDAWFQIQQMTARSSDHQNYDERPYGTALSQEGYPKIAQWASGHWDEESIRECLALMKTAIARGSRPMLQVGLLALKGHDRPKRRIWEQFSDDEKARLKTMLAIIA